MIDRAPNFLFELPAVTIGIPLPPYIGWGNKNKESINKKSVFFLYKPHYHYLKTIFVNF